MLNSSLSFSVSKSEVKLSKVFKVIEENKEELMIADWGIQQTTLEDVFMSIVKSYTEEHI